MGFAKSNLNEINDKNRHEQFGDWAESRGFVQFCYRNFFLLALDFSFRGAAGAASISRMQ